MEGEEKKLNNTMDIVVPLITLEVTPDIAIKMRFLGENGVFDMRGGNVTLNFAPNGELKSLKKETFVYAKVDN